MRNRKFGGFNGKGYYIALILCAAAIGISGYLYYRNTVDPDPQLQRPTGGAAVVDPNGDHVDVMGTEPGGNSDPTQPTDKKPMKTGRPLAGETVCDYAMDCLVYNPTTRDWRVHDGIDIAAEAGTQVLAAADGTVYTTYTDETMGVTVVIRHENGYVSVYSSLDAELSVETGDTVTCGQVIGKVGNTALMECAIGDHLHFSVTCNDVPMDPEDFFNLAK